MTSLVQNGLNVQPERESSLHTGKAGQQNDIELEYNFRSGRIS